MNPVLPAGITAGAIRASAVRRDVSKLTPAQLRAWAYSAAGAAAVASLTRGQAVTVVPSFYVERRATWGRGAGFVSGGAGPVVVPLIPSAVGLVSAPSAVPAGAESVAYNQATREAIQADKDLQADTLREVRKAEAAELGKVAQRAKAAARLVDREAKALAKAQREQAKATAKRISAAKERGPSQSWGQDVERLLESVQPESVEHLAISVAWRMASKAVRRVEGGSFKRSKAAARVETKIVPMVLADGAGVVESMLAEVTTGSGDDTGAAAWAGHAKLLSDTAKAEAFGAALAAVQSALAGHVPFDAARSSVCNGRRVWGASESVTVRAGGGRAVALLAGYVAKDGREVSHGLAIYGIAYRAAYRSLTKLDGGGTGRKLGGDSVTSSDSEDGARAVASWDAARAIGDHERADRFEDLPPVGLSDQRERAGVLLQSRFGIGCGGCRAIVGLKGAAGERGVISQAAKARRAVSGALLSVVCGADKAWGRVQAAGVYDWKAQDFLPQAAMSRWGASADRFSAALRELGLAVSKANDGGLACVRE